MNTRFRTGRILARLTTLEHWLPGAAAMAWWIVFYPGFFGDDSLIHLDDARIGHVPVWFTAWWIYVVRFVSVGTRAIPLLTLAGVLTLAYAVYVWIRTALPPGPPRALTVAAIALSPLVGAMGIQVRHDVAMTAALLLCAAVLTRTWDGAKMARLDFILLAMAVPLLPTRHNGVPTLAAAALVLFFAGRRRWRQAVALLLVAGAAWTITGAATRASGNIESMQPAQTVEWLMGDISCLLSQEGVTATPEEWATLERIAQRHEWPQRRACVVMNPVLRAPSFSIAAVDAHYRELIGVWRSMASRHPWQMLRGHASRVRLFLPPLVAGPPEVVSFLHSTILPNNLGLEWQWPSLAGRARVVVRAWNAMGYVLANSAVWLAVLIATAWRAPAYRAALMPAIIIGTVLSVGLVAAAPISEGRYGLFVLICGQATGLYLLADRVIRTSTRSSDRSSMRARQE